MDAEAFYALKAAVAAGALSARMATLTTLIARNKGHQIADVYEREIVALDRAAGALMQGEVEDR